MILRKKLTKAERDSNQKKFLMERMLKAADDIITYQNNRLFLLENEIEVLKSKRKGAKKDGGT